MESIPQLLALSYALPPNLYPQSIQIGRLLYHCPLKVGAISGMVEPGEQSMDCYHDFSSKMAFHVRVPFHAPLPEKLHSWVRKFVSFYGRTPDEFRFWITAAEKAIYRKIPNLRRDHLTMVSFGEPMSDHLLALRIKKKTGLPWVAHFSDPWADNPFKKLFFIANIFNRKMEREVIESADKVIFTSEETRSLVMKKYPSSWGLKTYVLPHSYDPTFYPEQPLFTDQIIVRYLGTFYGNRTPFPLLDALKSIYQNSPELLANVRFELIGGMPARMHKQIKKLILPHGLVNFLPSVSYTDSLRLMKESDLLLVIDAPAPLSVFLPSKLVDYVGAGVPVFGIVPPGSSANLIHRLGGLLANPDDQEAVISALTEVLRECLKRKASGVTQWGEETVRTEYDISQITPQFLEILQSASKKTHS